MGYFKNVELASQQRLTLISSEVSLVQFIVHGPHLGYAVVKRGVGSFVPPSSLKKGIFHGSAQRFTSFRPDALIWLSNNMLESFNYALDTDGNFTGRGGSQPSLYMCSLKRNIRLKKVDISQARFVRFRESEVDKAVQQGYDGAIFRGMKDGTGQLADLCCVKGEFITIQKVFDIEHKWAEGKAALEAEKLVKTDEKKALQTLLKAV